MSNVLIPFLNQIFPGSKWTDGGFYIGWSGYDLEQFHRIVEQKFPQYLWVIFIHLDDMVIYQHDFNKLLDWIREGSPQPPNVHPIKFKDLDTIFENLVGVSSFNRGRSEKELTNTELIVQFRDEEIQYLFPPQMLEYIIPQQNHIVIPLETISMVVDYLGQIFPIVYPTPKLITHKMKLY